MAVTTTCSCQGCIAHPVVLEESRLPSGSDVPNALITERVLRRLHLSGQSSLAGWIFQTNSPITSTHLAQSAAATNNLSVGSSYDAPISSEIVNGATNFALALALGIANG